MVGKVNMHIDGLVQERRKSSALAMELRLSCINPLISSSYYTWLFCDTDVKWEDFFFSLGPLWLWAKTTHLILEVCGQVHFGPEHS